MVSKRANRAIGQIDLSRTDLRASGLESARQMCRGLCQGRRIVGVSKGQFSSIDLVEAALDAAGPSDLLVTTWTIGRRDAEILARLVRTGRAKSARVLCDRSFPTRHPDRFLAVVNALSGVLDADRDLAMTNVHAKFWVLTGGVFDVACTTSMNLNTNARFESFDISCCGEIATFLLEVAAEVLEGGWGPAGAAGVERRFHEALDGRPTRPTVKVASWGAAPWRS